MKIEKKNVSFCKIDNIVIDPLHTWKSYEAMTLDATFNCNEYALCEYKNTKTFVTNLF